MTSIPNWTIDEFKILLNSKGTPPLNLTLRLPGKTAVDIAVVQQGIHSFHLGEDNSKLSKLMVDYLEDQRGTLVCPVCVRTF